MLDATTVRIRRGLARRAERILGALRLVEPRPTTHTSRPPSRPASAPVPTPEPVPFAAAGPAHRARPTPPPDDVVGAPIHDPDPVQEEAAAEAAEGPALDPAEVQEVFDEMIRPALQADGGDIELVKIEGPDVYVQLVGACSSCPSSVLTMKMGIERLLEEEFPHFGRLIQLGGPVG